MVPYSTKSHSYTASYVPGTQRHSLTQNPKVTISCSSPRLQRAVFRGKFSLSTWMPNSAIMSTEYYRTLVSPRQEFSMSDRLVSPKMSEEEQAVEGSLRPRHLDEYIGQEKIKGNLSILLEAARRRNEPIDHVLLYGPPGLGKTTLANIIAAEMQVNIRTTSGPAIEHPGELAALLTRLGQGDILFIDEIHRLSRLVEE